MDEPHPPYRSSGSMEHPAYCRILRAGRIEFSTLLIGLLIALALTVLWSRTRTDPRAPGPVSTRPHPDSDRNDADEHDRAPGDPSEKKTSAPPPPDTVSDENVPASLRGHDRYYRVEYVYDGDSLALETDREVRLIGVDAPEKDQPGANRARKTLRDLLPEGSVVALDFDRQKRDRFNRLLGYVYTLRQDPDRKTKTAVLVNRALIQRGLARVYLHRKNIAQKKALIRAQKQAVKARRNLFRKLDETEKEYFGIKGHYRFHRPGCRYIREIPDAYRVRFETKKEALKSGRSPGSSCSP